MRMGLAAVVALMLGAFGAHFLLQERGYVLLSFGQWAIEMSVPILILVLALLYLCVRLLLRLWRAPRALGVAFAEHRHRRAADRLTRGLIHMTEGDWLRSERLLTDGFKGGDAPLVNYLMAARAAHLQGSKERRNEWLRLAYEKVPEAETTVLLTQAELQFEDGEFEHALATVQRALETDSEHAAASALLADVLIALGDTEKLIEIVPQLAKAKLPATRLAGIAEAALTALLARDPPLIEDHRKLWVALPQEVKRMPAIGRIQALLLDRLGKGDEAIKELTAALKQAWHKDLVRAFGEVHATDKPKQLKRAESWLREHPDDGTLLLTAARLCIANELWGKARSYVESSIAVQPEPAAYSLYGRLLDQLGESEQAARAFHDGLSLVTGIDSEQPLLAGPTKSMADG